MIGPFATALTFLRNFKLPCLYVALAAAVVAGGLAGTSMWKLRGKVDQAAILKAEKELADWKASTAQARIDAKEREAAIMANARRQHDEQLAAIGGLSGDLQRIAAGVRVCTSVSTLRLSAAPAGSPAAPASGEPRPADAVLQELAAEFARRADTFAASYKSLMERWERVSSGSQP